MTIRIRANAAGATRVIRTLITNITALETATTRVSASVVASNAAQIASYNDLAAAAARARAAQSGTQVRTTVAPRIVSPAAPGLGAANAAATGLASGGLAQASRGAQILRTHMLGAFGSKMASQVQWIGRQITYNFSLPLAAAGTVGVKAALAVEAGMVRLKKVYGDVQNKDAFAVFQESEFQALGKAFEVMSNKFGVAQEDVANIGADWAQAGASGLALAESVKLTLETMVLGEIDSATATKALISTQAQWGLSITDTGAGVMNLSKAMDILNMTENESGASMSDLLDAFTRSAGSARTAGATIQELAALTASLVPAAGSAESAGNALKTIFSRILAPTKEAAQIMGLMGFNTESAGWQSLTATQRIEKLSGAWQGLTQNQKAQVSASIASRWQISKFDILMDDLSNSVGRYQSALAATKSEEANFAQRQKELTQVLTSNPERLKQAWQGIRNTLITAITPILPAIVSLVQNIGTLFKKFQELSPQMQKFITYAAVFLIVLGPAVRILGALGNLLLVLLSPLKLVFMAFFGLGNVLRGLVLIALSPFRIIGAGAMGLLGIFSRVAIGIVTAITWIPRALFAVNTVVMIVITAMRGAFLAIVAWLPTAVASIFALFTSIATGAMTIWATLPGRILVILSRIGPMVIAAASVIFSVPGLIVAAIIGLALLFKDQIIQIWNNLVKGVQGASGSIQQIVLGLGTIWNNIVIAAVTAFNALPKGIHNALQAVIDTVGKAVMAVYKLFSYLNPFAHHSPSLVETVTWGMAEIRKQYASVGNVGAVFKKAAADLDAFKAASAGMKTSEFADDRANVAKARPSALPAFDALEQSYNALSGLADEYTSKIQDQQNVVDGLKNKLDAANAALDEQNKIMDGLQGTLTALQAQYDKASSILSDFTSTPIEGMRAMSDEMFANQMEAKQLQLQMSDWEAVNGSIDKTRNKFADLGNEIDSLISMQADLRAKGAGSDILGPLQAQIDSLQGQRSSGTGDTSAYDALASKLDAVNKQGDRLDLLNSIKFDPLTRQIDQLATGMNEMPFDQIIAGVGQQKQIMDDLTPSIKAASDAVDKQQIAVDAAKAASDAIQVSYDAENGKLETLRKQYDEINTAIQTVTDTLHTMGDAASKANEAASKAAGGDKLTPGAANFAAGTAGDFPTQGGNQTIGREGGFTDQSAAIQEMLDKMTADLGGAFSSIDVFGPLKEQWNKLTAWFHDNIAVPFGGVAEGVKGVFSSIFSGDLLAGVDFLTPIQTAWEKVKQFFRLDDIGALIGKLFEALSPTFTTLFASLSDTFGKLWDTLGPSLTKLWETLGPLFQSLLPVLIGALTGFGGILLFIIGVIAGGLGPVIQGIIRVFSDLARIVAGVFEVFTGVFIIVGAVRNIFSILVGGIEGIIRIFYGLWEIISGIFTLDFTKVGKGLGDLFGGIIDFFASILTGVLGFFSDLWRGVSKIFGGAVDIIGGFFGGVWDIITTVFKTIWGGLLGGLRAVIDGIGAFLGDGWKKFTDFFGGLINWLAELPGHLFDIGSNIIAGLWNGILGALAWLLERIGEFFGWVVQHVKDFFGIHSPSTVFAEIGIFLVQGLIQGIAGLGQALLDIGIWIIHTVWDGIVWLAQTVWDWFKGVPGWVWNALVAVTGKIVDIGGKILNWIWDGIKNVASTVWDWFKGIPGSIAFVLGTVVTAISDIGSKVLNWIWDGIKAGAQAVWDWFKGIPDWIGNALSGIWDKIKQIGHDIAKKIGEGITNFFKSFVMPVPSADGGGWDTSGPGGGVATGGLIRGPGTGTSDSIKTMLSNGEYVVKASQTKGSLQLLQAINAGNFSQSDLNVLYTKAAMSNASGSRFAPASAGGAEAGISSGTVNNTITFNGDLSFPNIRSGGDAKELVQDLLKMSRGQ